MGQSVPSLAAYIFFVQNVMVNPRMYAAQQTKLFKIITCRDRLHHVQ